MPADRQVRMKKSINLWAFPYPDRMSLRDCLKLAKDAGFDGIELNYDLENDLSPKAGPAEFRAIRKLADEIGIAISGLCSFLYWPYSLTDNDPARRARGLELARLMIEAAHELGTENLLTIAGSTYIPWLPDREPVAVRRLRLAGPARRSASSCPLAEKAGVSLNIENIFFNGYLTTPDEMNAFVDSFGSKHIGVHFDTGNIMLFQFPEHWIPILGQRIRNVHFKEFSQEGDRPFARLVPHPARRHHQLAGRHGSAGVDRLLRLSHVRVFSSVPALPRGPDLSDLRRARSDPGTQVMSIPSSFWIDRGCSGLHHASHLRRTTQCPTTSSSATPGATIPTDASPNWSNASPTTTASSAARNSRYFLRRARYPRHGRLAVHDPRRPEANRSSSCSSSRPST